MPSRKALENALLELMEDLDGIASDAVLLARTLDDIDFNTFLIIRHCRQAVARAEALLAQVANRGGLSWDQIAGYYEVSKQALHRRLSARGEHLYQWAEKSTSKPELELSIQASSLR
jgi:hypothetical protein